MIFNRDEQVLQSLRGYYSDEDCKGIVTAQYMLSRENGRTFQESHDDALQKVLEITSGAIEKIEANKRSRYAKRQ